MFLFLFGNIISSRRNGLLEEIKFWYVAFQVHSVLADVSFLNDSHTSAVLRENLPK